jgi:type IV secretory pathway TrbL component
MKFLYRLIKSETAKNKIINNSLQLRRSGQETYYERKIAMPLITLVLVLVVVGIVLWLINSFIPMQSTIKKILNVVVVVGVVLWLLSAFGIINNLETIHIG